jgi:hypothetical protein
MCTQLISHSCLQACFFTHDRYLYNEHEFFVWYSVCLRLSSQNYYERPLIRQIARFGQLILNFLPRLKTSNPKMLVSVSHNLILITKFDLTFWILLMSQLSFKLWWFFIAEKLPPNCPTWWQWCGVCANTWQEQQEFSTIWYPRIGKSEAVRVDIWTC